MGSQSTAVGYQALFSQNYTTATNTRNTAVGYNAGSEVTTGTDNTLIGHETGNALTTGYHNTALGHDALGATDDGINNVAIGMEAMASGNAGSNNTVVGKGAGALMTGANNVALGDRALEKATSPTINIAIGSGAAKEVTTGIANIVIGYLAGNHGVNLQTGRYNTVIGHYADVAATDTDAANVIGYNVIGDGGYTTLGESTDDIRAAHGNVTWATVSDQRYKKDIVDSTAGLSFIKALKPRTFKYKNLGELPETFRAYKADSTDVFKNSNTNHGFIAQEVKTAIDADSGIKDGFKLWDERPDGSQEVAEAALIPILVKAIQELEARVAELEG